jgi:hypothetical protein
MMVRTQLLLGSAFCLLATTIGVCPVSADETTSTQVDGALLAKKPKAGEEAETKRTSVRALSGGIKYVESWVEDVREAQLDVKRVKSALNNLFDEVTREPVTWSMPPNLIGTTVISIPLNINFASALEPRKKWIDESMSIIVPVISLFKEDVDKAEEDDLKTLPEDAASELGPLRKSWAAAVTDVDAKLTRLKELTNQPSYDKPDIAATTKAIYNDMIHLDAHLKEARKILTNAAKEERRRKKQG